jgi:hypothetical protein
MAMLARISSNWDLLKASLALRLALLLWSSSNNDLAPARRGDNFIEIDLGSLRLNLSLG